MGGSSLNKVYDKDEIQTALLVSVDTGEFNVQTSLDELEELAATAGAEARGRVIQKRDSPDKATCIGAGRLEDIAEICRNAEIPLIIFDRELTSTQLRNIENATDCRVIDRTMLILDIFAGRARSAEGRLQVELAQLQYLLPRLTGKGIELSRLGGGIGTRGPGETKLETDRRHIRRRIKSLKEQLVQLEHRRETIRTRRRKDGVKTVAIVGYTNAGKSTLMNRLTDAGVLAEDKLFATLDPTARALKLPDGRQVLFIDTVGFVRRLPHHLVDAFRSTLEDAAEADVILNICDGSSPDAAEHLEIAISLLRDLGCIDRPIISVLNKCDIECDSLPQFGQNTVRISALTGEGIDTLLEAVASALPPDRRRVTLVFPYNKGALAEQCRREGAVESDEYTPQGNRMTVTIGSRLLELCKDFIAE
ncbi:MAG: GTPase HflX [Oscillospiraceae bacterium]|nr:GTPase HflX [Oscillospiraceae bacterium]MDD4413485.1 GTPase HflX [Oscillospiraceae bacterium]